MGGDCGEWVVTGEWAGTVGKWVVTGEWVVTEGVGGDW